MVANKKITGTAASMPKGLAISGGISTLITLIGCAVIALMTDKEILAEKNIGYGIMLILILASYAGSISAWNLIKHRRVLVCTAAGAVYFVVLLSITALFFGGQYTAVMETSMLVLCGSTLGILSVSHPKRTKIRPNRKRTYR